MASRERDRDDRRAALVRSLRALRRLETRLTGESAPHVWDRYFALESGPVVKYPFTMMLAFDHRSRERVVRDFLLAVWLHAHGKHGATDVSAGADTELLRMLGIPAGCSSHEVRAAFRALLLEVHPDLGGDEVSTRELIARYRASSFGGGAS